MQSRITDECDLILTWTWAERMELLGQIENIKQQMEQSFSKYFTNEIGPELAGPGRKEKNEMSSNLPTGKKTMSQG